jgi:hypothetical protein
MNNHQMTITDGALFVGAHKAQTINALDTYRALRLFAVPPAAAAAVAAGLVTVRLCAAARVRAERAGLIQ